MTLPEHPKQSFKQRMREKAGEYRHYKTLFHQTTEMIVLTDGYHVIDANRAFSRFFKALGFDVFDASFRLDAHFLPIDAYGYLYEGYNGKRWFEHFDAVAKKDRKVGISGPEIIHSFLLTLHPFKPEPDLFIVTFSDVTELMSYKCTLEENIHITTKEKAQASHTLSQYDQALDAANLIVRYDTYGTIRHTNAAFCQTLGYPPGSLLGTSITALAPTPSDVVRAHYFARWQGVLTNRCADGTIRYFDTTNVPITDIKGSVVEILSIRHDITQALHAKEEALEMLEAKTKFFDQVSHELRTPLNAIVNFIDQTIESFDEMLEDPATQTLVRRYLDRAFSNAQDLLALINALLDVAKIKSHKMHYDLRQHAVTPLAREAFDTCSALQKYEAVAYRFDPPESEIFIRCDGVKFKQILNNLLSNALKFTQKGSVKLGITVQSKWCLVSVLDTGIGIPAEKIDAIFEPFEQVRDHGFGTGLGLGIAKEFAHAMGMELIVRSVPQKGSQFILKIPLSQ